MSVLELRIVHTTYECCIFYALKVIGMIKFAERHKNKQTNRLTYTDLKHGPY